MKSLSAKGHTYLIGITDKYLFFRYLGIIKRSVLTFEKTIILQRKLYIHLLSLVIIFSALWFYLTVPFYALQFHSAKGFFIANNIHGAVLKIAAVFYAVYQFILIHKAKGSSKLEQLLLAIRNKKIQSNNWKDIRYTIVKLFFIPLMLPPAIIYFNLFLDLLQSTEEYSSFILLFNKYIFSLIIYGVSFITLAYYAFGYLIESKKLNSTVKSVDNTFFGWVVLAICYVPFFVFFTYYIPFPTQDYAFFINQEITFLVRILLSLLMLFKMYSVVNLGAKCSNLTNRGIVTKGPYQYIRHPHYLAKLLIWWITFLPYLIHHYWAIGAMVFWSVVYFLRALTEEIHLSKDVDYKTYKQQVKWMFIPYVV